MERPEIRRHDCFHRSTRRRSARLPDVAEKQPLRRRRVPRL